MKKGIPNIPYQMNAIFSWYNNQIKTRIETVRLMIKADTAKIFISLDSLALKSSI
jgi:hypothetical protein